MSKVKSENYIVIHGWMANEFGLKGNDLLVYAIIYGFSQDGETRFTGSLQYLADWVGGTKQGVLKNLKSLMEKGLICKAEKQINGVKFCEYYTTEFNGVLNSVDRGIKLSLTEGIKQSLTNNIDINKKEDNIKDNIQEVIRLYHSLCPSLPKCLKITEQRRKAVKARLKAYTLDDLAAVFERAEKSDFLKNGSGTWNGANFDWIINERNITKIMEGQYDNRGYGRKAQELDTSYRMMEEWAKEI